MTTSTGPILITGAAGNLGGLLARRLLAVGRPLRLMYHRRPLPADLQASPLVQAVQADLAVPGTLGPAIHGVSAIVHFAGVLFAPRPERFLPETNTGWFDNLMTAALAAAVPRVLLVSFPHVEGPTTVDAPATGRLDRTPVSVHARTRLAEERLLLNRTRGTGTIPVVLRLGMVYGKGILMVDAARYLAKRRLLGVWRDPTWIQVISTEDAMEAMAMAVIRPGIHGIYHIGDEQPVTLQRFLDTACAVWGYPAPRRLPTRLIRTAAICCEAFALLARTRSPLTRDFIDIGQVSYWGDTTRMRAELLTVLRHPNLASGVRTLA